MSKSPSLRRIQADIRELSMDPSDRYFAAPLENDMFEWHFTIKGADGTDFEGGVYHGRILLPAEYPFKPPNIVFLTPNGRFETGMKVCLSFSAYHPELWQPAWGIRLILEALISFLPTKGDGAIGALDWPSDERKRLAKESVKYNCPTCGNCNDILKKWEKKIQNKVRGGGGGKKSRFQKEIEQLHAMQAATEGEDKATGDGEAGTDDSAVKDDKEDENASKDIEKECVTQVDGVSERNDKETSAVKKDDDIDTENSKSETLLDDKEFSATDSSNKKGIDDDKLSVDAASNNSDPSENKKVTTCESRQASDIVLGTVKNDTPASSKTEQAEVGMQSEPTSTEDNIPEGQEGEENDIVQADELSQPVGEEVRANNDSLDTPWISDPVVHTGIVVLSIIIYLLARKIQAIIAEMKELEAQFRS